MAVLDRLCFLGRRAEDCPQGPENPEYQKTRQPQSRGPLKMMHTAVCAQ